MIDEAVRQTSETKTALIRVKEYQHQAQTPAEKNNRRMMHRKLSDNLSITARVLEDIVRRYTAHEKQYLASLEPASCSPVAAAGLDCTDMQFFSADSPLGDGDVAGGDDRHSMSHKPFEQEL